MTAAPAKLNWQKLVAQYQRPDLRRSLWQMVNSFVPYLLMWYLMYRALSVSYWLTLLLAVPAAGFIIRIFIIFHDCGHGSFFKSQKANDIVGSLCGVFAFTPYFQWRHNHALHHAGSGDLDRRVTWDLPMTWTVQEYLARPRWQQIAYRLYRHPVVLLGLAPGILFVFGQRIVSARSGKREQWSVHFTNLAVLALGLSFSYFIGWKAYVMVQLPITLLSSTIGVWLFYVQHQFEDTYWAPGEEWEYAQAAMQGSSYYKLPRLLQWFTGNIGLHHIHHLSPRIPNYALEECHRANPELQQVPTITLLGSLKTMSLRLWDEERKKLIGFRELQAVAAERARAPA